MNRRDPRDGKELRFELEGRLDAAWSGSLGKNLLEVQRSGCECVTLGFSRVEILSSAGIRVLLMLAKGFQQGGGRLRILDPIPPVREVLEWVGLRTLIDDTGDSLRPMVGRAEEEAGACPSAVNSLGGADGEVYELDRSVLLEGTLVGTGDPFPRPDSVRGEPVMLRFSRDSLGLGLGAFGAGVDCWRRAGELLAVAETEVLVGAALQVPLALLPADPFAYPNIQGHLSFTAEPAYVDETALIVGFAAVRPIH